MKKTRPQANDRPLSDQAQRFLCDVDSNPYDVLHQYHTPNTKIWCRIEGYAEPNADGTWSLTQKGSQAVSR